MVKTVGNLCQIVNDSPISLSLPDKPGTPRSLDVTEVTKDSVTLTWQAPTADGGAPITGYTIEKRDASKNNWIGIGNVDVNKKTFTAGRLWEGCEYFFRVAAENAVGLSDFNELKTPVMAKLPYSEYGILNMNARLV